jgi:hypothetical protein
MTIMHLKARCHFRWPTGCVLLEGRTHLRDMYTASCNVDFDLARCHGFQCKIAGACDHGAAGTLNSIRQQEINNHLHESHDDKSPT